MVQIKSLVTTRWGNGRWRLRNPDRVIAVLLVLPSLVVIAVFVYGFIGFTAFASLTRWDNLVPDFSFVGLENYVRLFNTQRFQIDLRNTVTFTSLFLATSLALGFLLAVLLDRRIRVEGIFRSLYLFPLALSSIVTGVVSRWLLKPGSADLRRPRVTLLLDTAGLGFPKTGWYTDPRIGPQAVAIAAGR